MVFSYPQGEHAELISMKTCFIDCHDSFQRKRCNKFNALEDIGKSRHRFRKNKKSLACVPWHNPINVHRNTMKHLISNGYCILCLETGSKLLECPMEQILFMIKEHGGTHES